MIDEQRRENEGLGLFGTSASLAVGGAIGYSAAYPWSYRKVDTSQYPRLESLRRAGRHGFKIITPHITLDPEEQSKKGMRTREKVFANLMWKELDPSKIRELKDFEGVAYIQSGEYKDRPLGPKIANWGNWDVGEDKLVTWEHLKSRGKEDLHIKTIGAENFYGDGKLTKEGQAFLDEAGGTSGLVVKRKASARGRGVWLDASKLPEDIAEEMYRNPREFILQQKMDIAEEFRVVTVGDKPIDTTYRFGSPKARKLADFLGFKSMKDVSEKKVFTKSPFEVVQPVFDKELKGRIEDFATKVSKEIPYEIGALDIAMDKQGGFKLVEAQRQFGNISNPIVSRRLRHIITGKSGILGAVSAGVGAIGAFGIASSLFGKSNDGYNNIEGLHPGSEGLGTQMVRRYSDFGSKWNPLKTLAKAIFKSDRKPFESLIKSSGFQKALEEGTVLKELGQGRFGTALLVETTYKGQKFKYVKKNIKGIENPFLETISEAKRIEVLKSEFETLKKVEGGIAPSAYGHSTRKNELYMELMPGKPVEDLREELSESAIDQIRKEIDEVSKRGIENPDIHAGNIMYDPETSKVSWIDWGLAREKKDASLEVMNKALDEKVLKVNKEIASKSNIGSGGDDFFDDWGDIVSDPQKQKRMANFNAISEQAVGAGLRAHSTGAKGHAKFASTGDFF